MGEITCSAKNPLRPANFIVDLLVPDIGWHLGFRSTTRVLFSQFFQSTLLSANSNQKCWCFDIIQGKMKRVETL
jgi:hypothetical protein